MQSMWSYYNVSSILFAGHTDRKVTSEEFNIKGPEEKTTSPAKTGMYRSCVFYIFIFWMIFLIVVLVMWVGVV